MKRIYIILSLILGCFLSSNAQQSLHRHLWVEDGNVPVKVNALTSDPNSYIFLGTEKGLYRFNGRKFSLVESANKAAVNALSIYKGKLWVGFGNGKLAYLQQDSLVPFSLPKDLGTATIKCILAQKNDELWIGTDDGLFHYRNKSLRQYNTESGLSDNYIYKIISANDGSIWVATDQGLNQLSPSGNTFHIEQWSTAIALKDEIVSAMTVLDNDHFVIGSERGTLAILNTQSGSITPIVLTTPIDGQIQSILKVADNKLMISTAAAEIYSLNVNINYVADLHLEIGMPLSASDLLQDKSGNIWAATENGLSQLTSNYLTAIPLKPPFQLSKLTAMVVDQNNQYWLALDKTLYRISKYLDLESVHSFPSKISVLHIDGEHTMWIGTSANGVWQKKRDQIAPFKTASDMDLEKDGILSITSNDKQVWFSGLSGLRTFNLHDHSQIDYPKNISDHYIYKLFSDRQNRLWMATDGAGISRLEANNITDWQKLGGKKEDVVYSLAGAHTQLWAAGMSNNIYQLNKNQWTLFAAARPNHIITGLQANESGQLIATFQNCVDQWYPNSNMFRHFNARQNFGIDSLSQTLNVNAKDNFGNILVPYDKGILVFRNQEAQAFDIKPNVIITQVTANYETVRVGHNQLDAGEYLFSFVFDGISFTNPERLQFRYKLEGYNNDWLYTKDLEATFPKIKWGNYVFKVQVSLSSDFEHAQEAVYQFSIARPLLYRPWFIVLMVAMLVGLIILIVKLRERRLKKITDLKEEKMRFEFEHLKSQVNPHFLFNSLNTLTGLIEEEPENAVIYTERLSDLYRHSLQSYQKDKAPVKEELDLLHSYIYIQEARFGTAIQVDINVSQTIQQQHDLPAMALQLVVENAMKHNIVAQSQPLLISIFVLENCMVISNKINRKKNNDAAGGLGLKNLDRRYKMLSGKNIIYGEKDGYWQVKLPLL